jgi:hypothetical protein
MRINLHSSSTEYLDLRLLPRGQPRPLVRLSRMAILSGTPRTQANILNFLDCIILIFFEIDLSYTRAASFQYKSYTTT